MAADPIFEQLDVGLLASDAEGRLLYANRMALDLLGLELEASLGHTPWEMGWDAVDARGRALSADELPTPRVLRERQGVRGMVLGLKRPPARERVWVRASAAPRFGETGQLAEVVVSLAHAGAERRQRSGPASSEDGRPLLAPVREAPLLRSGRSGAEPTPDLLASMPGLFLYQAQVDAGGRVELVYLSPGAEQVLGWGPADLPIDLERLGSRVHPEDLPAFLPSKAARTRGPIDVEVRMRAHEETPWRWTSVRARAEPAGASTVWSGTVLDVDDRRRLAAALERMQRLEAVGVLAAGVAHNFNNLLAVILPNLEHALEEAPSGLVPPLEDALDASRRARELVHQLTVVGNRDRRQPHGWVDLASLVRNVADLFRSSAGPGLRVDAEIGVDPAPVHGREAQLHQTLMDLALNAQDAVEGQAAPHVVFRLRDAADELRLEIEDNGEGMRSSQIARLGEPFFTTKAPDRGTGLGVATAFRVIRDHGGRMDFASRPGAGTKVSVALPRAPAAPAEPEARDAPPAAARADAPVLVVDDDPLVRRSVARTLRRHRFEVHEAEDGWSALETVRALEVGLMLIDVNMPALSGAEVMSRVAAFRPEVPVVLMSGTLDADVASLGAAALLQKPVRAEALVETVARVLERAGA